MPKPVISYVCKMQYSEQAITKKNNNNKGKNTVKKEQEKNLPNFSLSALHNIYTKNI